MFLWDMNIKWLGQKYLCYIKHAIGLEILLYHYVDLVGK
jgi:hypothetical protein